MNDVKKLVAQMLKEIKQKRDELKVQVHLAKLDAGDEWKNIEEKFHRFEAKSKELGHATAQSSSEIGAAAKRLGEEILEGFKNIGRHL